MNNETITTNTPETLGVTPRYVLQHNAVSRSAHNLSATAQKLTAMAMALLPADLSSLSASFTFTEFCKSVGYDKGGESFTIFINALRECLDSKIAIEILSPETGNKHWHNYTWFVSTHFNEDTGKALMNFSPELAAVLKELKRVYARINLRDIGELQSKYAIHIYEMAVSYASLQGKGGNREKAWYFERTIPELRTIFQIPTAEYKETKRLRQKVIEEPIKEINNAGIGVTITAEGVKQGRRLAALRFECEQSARKLPTKRRRRKNAEETTLAQPDLFNQIDEAREEKELQHLKELYPDDFTALYTAEIARLSFLPPDSTIRKRAAETCALVQLREKHGIVK